MAWFLNYCRCARCGAVWTDAWSCTCDDDCRRCGARHMSPFKSDDLSEIVVPAEAGFAVLRSPDTAGHYPDYEEVARFPSEGAARAFLSGPEPGP